MVKSVVKRVVVKTVGDFKWDAPVWMPASWSFTKSWVRAHPKRALVSGLSLILLSSGSYYTYSWWQSRPKPSTIEYTVTAPELPSTDGKEPPPQLLIQFRSAVADLKHTKKIDHALIGLGPDLPGEWIWSSDTTIVFTPNQAWPIGQTYKIRMSPKLFTRETLLENYTPKFESPRFIATLSKSEFYQNPENRKQKQVIVHLRFSHPVDPDSLKKRVKMNFDSKKSTAIPFNVTFGKNNREGYIVSEALAMPEKETNVSVRIEKGYHALAGGNDFDEKLEASVTVPGVKTFFHVSSAEIRLVPDEKLDTDQVFSVSLTDDIGENDFRKNLQLYLLPEKKTPEGKPIAFQSAGEISPELLKESTPVALEMIPNERDYSPSFNFKIHQAVGRTLFLKIGKGMKSLGDFETAVEYQSVLTIPPYPPLLQLQQSGGILSFSGEKKLAIAMRGVKRYRVGLSRIQPDQIANLMSQTSGGFSSPQFINYRFNFENLSEEFKEDRDSGDEGVVESGKLHYGAIDLGKYIHASGGGNRGLFHVRLSKLNDRGEETGGARDSRLILVTDLGLLVKQNADRSREIFVQSIRSGAPLSGVTVEVIGKNGNPVLSARTDENGRVNFPDLKDFNREKEPFVFTARLGGDFSFIPVDVRDRGLSLSRFDIGGVQSPEGANPLSAYLFSDRGIYRPGDEVNIGYIVKSEKWSKATLGAPVEAVVQDARGLNVHRERIELSPEGFGSFKFQTLETSPTGIYQAEFFLIEKDGADKKQEKRTHLGSTTVKIEEFIPDTMKISSHLSQEKSLGWVTPKDLKALISLRNLYGSPAADHKITASFTLTPSFPKVPAFPDYRFFDPKLGEKSYTERLDEKKTNDKGEVEFDLNLDRFESGTYRLVLDAEGFALEGGRSVAARSVVIVSPLNYILGYKSASNLDYLKLGSKAAVHVLGLGSDLKPVAIKATRLVVQEVRTLSVLTKDSDGAYRYQSVKKAMPISDDALVISEKGVALDLKTDQPGTFAVFVRDGGTKDLLKFEYSVVGQTNVLKKLERNSELQLKLGKTDFEAGEDIEMQITAPYTGAGLITIEREKVHAVKWFKTSTTNSVQKIRIPASLEGTAYVHVTFMRSLDSREVFTNPLSIGVVPFSISKKKRETHVTLKAPALVKPGEQIEISYQASRPSKIIIYGADEGILQVAGYKKPDPLQHFLRKRMLEVQTSQLLDLVLPEFSVLKAVSASGGDADGALGKNLNPFRRKTDKPVAFWSGVLDAGPGTKKFTYTVPDYFNGSIHLFAVAVSEAALGVTDESTAVKGDFIISPVAPLFTTPGDEFDVSVAVANNFVGSGKDAKLDLTVKTSPELKIVGESSLKVSVAEGREGAAHFRIKTQDLLGVGKLEFTAGIAANVAHYKLEMSVSPVSPYETTIRQGSLKSDDEELKFTRSLYSEFGKRLVSVSAAPLAFSHGLTQYLTNYPYGCTEQLVSKAFPILVLRNRKDFATLTTEHSKSLDAMTSLLRSRQTSEGGFSTWPGSNSVNEFYTAYATHFMLEAQDRGFIIPSDVRSRATTYLGEVAVTRTPGNLAEARVKAYEIYLLARSGVVLGNVLVSLREQLDAKWKDWRQDVTAVFLAGTYKLYHQDTQAEELIRDLKLGQNQVRDSDGYVTPLFRDGIVLDVMSRHFSPRLTQITGEQIEKFSEPLKKGNYNTISSAMAILGLDSYTTAIASAGILKAIQVSEKEGKDWKPLSLSGDTVFSSKFSLTATNVKVKNTSELSAFYQITESGFDRNASTSEISDGLEVTRKITDGDGNEVKAAKVGQTYYAHLRFRATKVDQANVAIVDRIPSGFEIILDRSRPQARVEEPAEESAGSQSSEEGGREGEGEGVDDSEQGGSYFWKGWGSSSAYADESGPSFIPEYLDLREDRVIVYAAVTTTPQEFVYQLKATNVGTFQVPAVYAENMYDRSVRARSSPGKIEVQEAK